MIRWIANGDYLSAIGGSRACLLRSILIAGGGLGGLDLMLEALGDAKGSAWVPDWPGDARMGWIAPSPGREHCFTRIQDPGDGQSGRRFVAFGLD